MHPQRRRSRPARSGPVCASQPRQMSGNTRPSSGCSRLRGAPDTASPPVSASCSRIVPQVAGRSAAPAPNQRRVPGNADCAGRDGDPIWRLEITARNQTVVAAPGGTVATGERLLAGPIAVAGKSSRGAMDILDAARTLHVGVFASVGDERLPRHGAVGTAQVAEGRGRPLGFRSSFRRWPTSSATPVEAGYARSDLFERRLLVLDEWRQPRGSDESRAWVDRKARGRGTVQNDALYGMFRPGVGSAVHSWRGSCTELELPLAIWRGSADSPADGRSRGLTGRLPDSRAVNMEIEGMRCLVAVFVLALSVPVATLAQSNPGTNSYQYLSEPGKRPLGNFVDAERYRRLTKSQRSTYESITHALESVGKLDIVQVVTAIWGADPGSTDGKDQFRLSVILADGAVEDLLLPGSGFEKSQFLGIGWGHVKRPDGTVVGYLGADSVRQDVRRPPSLQISWLEADPRVGEIDIDYREGSHHNLPANSDVTDELPDDGPTHYKLHGERYGAGLVRWWR